MPETNILKPEKTIRTGDLSELSIAAIEALTSALADGDRNAKHAAGSWRQETEENQIDHATQHAGSLVLAYALQPSVYDSTIAIWPPETESELDHAICRLIILKALRKRRNAGLR